MQRNPQAEQMAHTSMLENLSAQASAIWPQEQALFDRYALPADALILDVGCGSGEITRRLAERFTSARVVGVDILDSLLQEAATHCVSHGDRVRLQQENAFSLSFEDNSFDLIVCRHLTQAVPDTELLLAELIRVCKPGGWLHVLSEDYSMLHFPHDQHDIDSLFRDGVIAFARATGTDARIGRRTWSQLVRLGMTDVRVDYITVDTLRVPRSTFAQIMTAWRDGYCEAIEHYGALPRQQVRPLFDAAIDALLDEQSYAVWHIPVVSGHKRKIS